MYPIILVIFFRYLDLRLSLGGLRVAGHEISDQTWVFRFSEDIQHPIERIGGISSMGIPYHLPEISLLLKALRLRAVDEQDFQQVLPKLNQIQKLQLFGDIKKINPEHIWLSALV